LFKGNLNFNRGPLIKIDEKSIKRQKEFKYLGVILDEKLNFRTHVTAVKNKAIKISHKIVIPAIGMELWRTDSQDVLLALKKWEHDIESVGLEMIVQDRLLYENIMRTWNTLETKENRTDARDEAHESQEDKDETQTDKDENDVIAKRQVTEKRTEEKVRKKRKLWKSWINRLYKKKHRIEVPR